jgi:hypothetical protein
VLHPTRPNGSHRGRGVIGIVAGLVAALVMPAVATAGDVPAPSQWPASSTAAPEIESWTNAIRYAGPNREQTSLALALGLRGARDYPFDTPDPSSGNASTLAAADDWWGVGTCPRAIIVVAGDTPADSLAASSLSDPTDQSSEPFLQRSAAADPLFDPVGGFARVDTQAAPIIVTRSTRQGATALGVPARLAAQDLRSGGCTLARQAIIVGGPSAVPSAVDAELVGLGYDEVFRVAGANRYATAAAIASALGTGDVVDEALACADPAVDDGDARMGFYGNATIELRFGASACQVLGRTVVLAEGLTGADALAAGWWTSFWQVPVLLHDGSGTLPPATVGALTTLGIDNVVVLGGTARIPDSILDDVHSLTDASVTRISGGDRYATSVEMARRLGGWWPSGRADEYAASMVCLAASSGDGTTGRGWPDALGAGPWCAAANGAAGAPSAPVRALAPLTGGQPASSASAAAAAHDAVPVLLVPAGATTLPSSVEQLLTAAFEPTDSFCSSVEASSECTMPGFVIAVGGATVLPSEAIARAAQLVAGGTPTSGTAAPPALDDAFYTSLDLTPVFAANPAVPDHICVGRDGYRESRWLAVLGAPPSSAVFASIDAMLDGRYVRDADGIVRSAGVGSPACASFTTGSRTELRARGVGIAGRIAPEQSFATAATNRFALTAAVSDTSPDATTGTSSSDDTSNGGSTTQTYITLAPAAGAISKGASAPVASASITLTITRGTDLPSSTGVDRFSASTTIATPNGTVTSTATGEALFVDGIWKLRGMTTMTGGSWNVTTGTGGFVGDLSAGATPEPSDDSISWRLDALAD